MARDEEADKVSFPCLIQRDSFLSKERDPVVPPIIVYRMGGTPPSEEEDIDLLL